MSAKVSKIDSTMTTSQILEYAAQLGRRLADGALDVEVMFERAKELGVYPNADKNEIFKKLAPLGEYEVALLNIIQSLISVKAQLFNLGVKMTAAEVEEKRMKKFQFFKF